MKLPEKFIEAMKFLLKDEYFLFEASFEQASYQAVRRNSLKIDKAAFEAKLDFLGQQVAWCEESYYIDDETRPGKEIGYHCGLYYIQEPSASLPVSLLKPNPGEKILDLCASPGGKTTQIGAKMKNKGVLVANDISYSRLAPLKRNLQLFGITNSIISHETPDRLKLVFDGYFDKILIDAPCSGEGMFRRDEKTRKKYDGYAIEDFAIIQKQLLNQAKELLKPGGQMVYSTCTFTIKENEEVIQWFLSENSDFSIILPEEILTLHNSISNGLEGMDNAVRIWPHKHRGEGHFAALLQHKGTSQSNKAKLETTNSINISEVESFYKEIGLEKEEFYKVILQQNNRIMCIKDLPDTAQLKTIYKGLEVGFLKNGRFLPSQSFAMALQADYVKEKVNISKNQPEALKYLKGETIPAEGSNGWKLVCIDDYPVGWGKLSDGMLKNHYLKEWRLQ